MKKWGTFYSGIMCISLGILFIINPVLYDYMLGYQWDLSTVKWPLSICLFVMGILCFYSFIKYKKFNEFLICPKCVKTYYKYDLVDNKCLDCGVEVEELDGFFERHPELKGSKESV